MEDESAQITSWQLLGDGVGVVVLAPPSRVRRLCRFAVQPESALQGGGGVGLPAARRGVLLEGHHQDAPKQQLCRQRAALRLHQPASAHQLR